MGRNEWGMKWTILLVFMFIQVKVFYIALLEKSKDKEHNLKKDVEKIPPELRGVWKSIPKVTFNKFSLPIFRLLIKLMPTPAIPAGVIIEQAQIDTTDGYQLPLRIYKPAEHKKPSPALVWMHGGGYIFGKLEMEDENLADFVRQLGIVVISVDYRLAPEFPFPTPLEDCYCALKWTHEHANDLGTERSRIAIGGASAGGGLAACLAQLAKDRGEVSTVLQLLVYPMLDVDTIYKTDVPYESISTWNNKSNRFGWQSYLQKTFESPTIPPYSVAARRQNLSDLPPTWIGVGDLDLFFEENRTYAARLKESGVECELVVVPGAFHAFDMKGFEIPITKEFRNSQIASLRNHLFGIKR